MCGEEHVDVKKHVDGQQDADVADNIFSLSQRNCQGFGVDDDDEQVTLHNLMTK